MAVSPARRTSYSADPETAAAPEPAQFASLGFTVLAVMGLILKARKRRSQGEAV